MQNQIHQPPRSWIREWDNSGPRHLSLGCVVMHIYDISKLYEQIPEGTMVVIF